MNTNYKNIAIYFDADNIVSKYCTLVLDEVKKLGKVRIANVYGDWSKSEVKTWINVASNNGLELVQCTRVNGKQSTDIKMIVDIMGTLYRKPDIDIFVIVSCDGDYAHVAREIRREKTNGLIFAFGYSNTAKVLKNCCDRFVNIEMLSQRDDDDDDDDDEVIGQDQGKDQSQDNELPMLNHFNNNKINKVYYSLSKAFNKKKFLLISKVKRLVGNEIKSLLDEKEYRYLDKYIEDHFSNRIIVLKKQKKSKEMIWIYDMSCNEGNSDVLSEIVKIIENLAETEVNLGRIKENIMLVDNTFDNRNYGFAKMSDFISHLYPNDFKIKKYNEREKNGIFIELL